MQRATAKHRTLGRSTVELDARDPSLINLSLPVNSIPVVGPLVSPLLSDGDGGNAQPSSSPNPQPAPTSSAGSGGSGGNGAASSPTPSSPTSGGGGTAVPPASIVSSPATPATPATPASAPGNTPGSPNANSASSVGSVGGSMTSSPSLGGGGNFIGTGGGGSVPVNAGSRPFTTRSGALGGSASTALATGVSSPSQPSPGSGSNTDGIISPSPTTAVAASSGGRLSGGAIAGITIVCLLFLLALILLVVRRRSMARRIELRRRWFGRSASGGNSSLANGGSARSPLDASVDRQSARSSFATNFDEGLMFRIDSPTRHSLGVVPDLPPMAQVRERNSVLISTGGAVARRESLNSMLSNGSESDAQYLTIPASQNNPEPSTPMSVRPFSPSESFAFPKPPGPPSSTANSFFIPATLGPTSPRSSAATLVHLSTPPRALMADLPPAPATSSLHPQALMPSVTLPLSTAPANPSVNPFADPAKPGFADVEIIRRPFTPSLDDEMTVHPGDRVRLLQVFDDGWAFVEKLPRTESECDERGLIPVDCLRDASQALPTFLAQKRVSEYWSDQLIAAAL